MVLIEIVLAQLRRQWPSITSAFSQCIVLSAVSGDEIVPIVTPMQQSENTVQSPNAVSILGLRQRLCVNIETALGKCHVFAQSIQQTK